MLIKHISGYLFNDKLTLYSLIRYPVAENIVESGRLKSN